MDGSRFDDLVRSLDLGATRRGVLGALFGGVLAQRLAIGADARRGGGKDRRDRKRRGKTSGGRRTPRRPRRAQSVETEGACYTGSPCLPGPGKNLGKCDFADSPTLRNKNLKGANLGSATVARGDAGGANLHGANLDKACLVDADLSGASVNGSTSMATAILCRTVMPDGSEDNSGCGKGTSCCPTCDDDHPCAEGEVCCNGRCRAGECCTADACDERACQTVRCRNFSCDYREQEDGFTGTLCDIPRECCAGVCCAEGQTCCGGECQPGECCSDAECSGVDPICCGGVCIPGARCCTDNEPGCPPDQECVGGVCAGGGPVCASDGECPGAETSCCGGACCPAACQCGIPNPLLAAVAAQIAAFCGLPFPFYSAIGTGQRCGPGMVACPADTTCLSIDTVAGTIGACAGLCPGAEYPPLELAPQCAALLP